MAITLGAITLPSGLVWSDEYAWSPVQQSEEYGLTGALIVQIGSRLAGRPITLIGQSDGGYHTAWITRANLETLRTALIAPNATWTLTLNDSRTFTVRARHDGDGPLDAESGSVVRSFSPANPASSHRYYLKAVRLMVTA